MAGDVGRREPDTGGAAEAPGSRTSAPAHGRRMSRARGAGVPGPYGASGPYERRDPYARRDADAPAPSRHGRPGARRPVPVEELEDLRGRPGPPSP
ncbi:hypothetical protein K378_00137 [Streptomyces sp. Amel2xB2]|nr:hypothetical protein K378_00137 [Streptomyces sp. Amel2xB2]